MKEKLRSAILLLVPLSLLFAVVFTLLRVYEFFLMRNAESAPALEAMGFLYDWPFAFLLIVGVVGIGLILALLHLRAARIFGMVAFSLLLLVAFVLIQYFSVTFVPLSADLFGYSMSDITTTVNASGGFNILAFLILLLYLLLFIGGSLWLMKKSTGIKTTFQVSIIILLSMAVIALLRIRPAHEQFMNDNEYNLVVNKSQYFYSKAATYFGGDEDIPGEDIPLIAANSYPFLKPVHYNDGLGQYLQPAAGYPNLVFIMVEGLGREFMGPDASYGGFTPFLDSLAAHSLYWKNGLSNAGRTFGALPSILGSLPYGKEGFMSYGNAMPDHQTLMSLLKDHGYTANFFYGGNPNFDNQDLFLQYQGVDRMLNESNFSSAYQKTGKDERGFTWGYTDRDVFNHSLEILSEKNTSPRLDVYLTLSTHEPFKVPEQKYEALFDTTLKHTGWDDSRRKRYTAYCKVFECLLYTDEALRDFFGKYKHRPEFQNTIFVITGDHRLIPVPQATRISRFHVPIIIYSPRLKNGATFGALALHSDITPSMLGFLGANYNMKLPAEMPFISKGLSFKKDFSSNLDIALIRNKGEVDDFIYGDHFLSEGRLFEIAPNLDLKPVSNDSMQRDLTARLKRFKSQSVFACENNRVDKIASHHKLRSFTFTPHEEAFISEQKLLTLTPDQLFTRARDLAFEKRYDKSRVILRVLLNGSPNYHDARILLARTFAWSGQYDTARYYIDQVLNRSPYYDDAFCAAADIEYWEGNHKASLSLAEKGLAANPNNVELMVRQARGLWVTGRTAEADKVLKAVLQLSPQHEMALDILQKISQ